MVAIMTNYGTSSLVEWLDCKLSEGSGIQNVLIVLIHGAPTVQREQRPENCSECDVYGRTTRGWFYQLYAPIRTLLNVRSAAQIFHSNLEIRLLKKNGRKAFRFRSRRLNSEEVIRRFRGT